MANTQARLHHLYGPNHSFELRSLPGRGAVVSVSVPFRESLAASAGSAGAVPAR